jgi:hypothetical protein
METIKTKLNIFLVFKFVFTFKLPLFYLLSFIRKKIGKTADTTINIIGKACTIRLNSPTYPLAVSFKVGNRKMLNTKRTKETKNFPSSTSSTSSS